MTDAPKQGEDDDFEIEVVDDTPEEDKNRPRLPEGESPEIPSEDDLEQYSEGVQKRIKKLTFAANEERRQKEEALRIQAEAIEFARRQKEEADNLRQRLQKGDEVIVSQTMQRLKSEIAQTKATLKAAYEAGDSDAVVESQAKLAALSAEAVRVGEIRPRPAAPATTAVPAPAPTPPQTQQYPQVQPPSARAREWAAKNEWFGKDEEMTALAFGVNERLIRQGVALDSEMYYAEIDAAIRRRFPEKFGGTEEPAPRRQPSSVVAPGGRSTATTPRKVVLTATQVSLARRLGLTPEQYAAQLIKEQKNG